nr:fimbrial protein [Dyella sp. ASV24]
MQIRSTSFSQIGHPLLKFLVMLLLLVSAKDAFATCTATGSLIFTLSMPQSITVPRDLPVGTPLTGLISSQENTAIWSCTLAAMEPFGAQAMIGPAFTANSGQTYTGTDGVQYTIWNTNVAGVGLAAASKIIYNWPGCPQSGIWWGPSTLTAQWFGPYCYSSNAHPNNTVGAQIGVALIKTGPITTGGVIGGIVAMAAPLEINLLPSLQATYVIGNVTIVPQQCTTKDVTVSMGRYSTGQFAGIGSTTPAVNFTIGLNGCPAGMKGIRYQIDSALPLANTTNSVVTLDRNSMATGIGLQLLDSQGNPLPLGTQRTFASYNTTAGGDFTIPLQARYYQTSATINPGTANTSMTFTMTYQ